MRNLKEVVDLTKSNLLLNKNNVDNYIQKWLIPSFIETNKLVNFYAKAGNGKSITTLFLAVYLLKTKAVKQVFYIDADNGLGTLKNRSVGNILAKYPNLHYLSFAKKVKDKDIDTKSIIFTLAKFANDSHKDTLIIFDSIRNFIKGSMSLDEVVIPYLEALQAMRDYYAGVWFLHHQNKQSFSDDENKEYKGATAFIDSVDEAYFVRKRQRNENRLIVTLEPQKRRDNTKPQAVVIDTDTQELEFDDYDIYAMNDKQAQALEYAKEIIKENPSGINLKNLTNEIKRMAKIDEAEICGINVLKKLLMKFDNKFYKIDLASTSYKQFIFKPL